MVVSNSPAALLPLLRDREKARAAFDSLTHALGMVRGLEFRWEEITRDDGVHVILFYSDDECFALQPRPASTGWEVIDLADDQPIAQAQGDVQAALQASLGLGVFTSPTTYQHLGGSDGSL